MRLMGEEVDGCPGATENGKKNEGILIGWRRMRERTERMQRMGDQWMPFAVAVVFDGEFRNNVVVVADGCQPFVVELLLLQLQLHLLHWLPAVVVVVFPWDLRPNSIPLPSGTLRPFGVPVARLFPRGRTFPNGWRWS
jgi:hypothetical protein